ncbi:unnamed protein product (macronuclear) [Paramecium tetraurelia]|uniref:EF-hand domain-containing protein n=1 Tax=Paramecium tetraurelia TaxID=5888 RepID=A0CSA6_PARTE|nr:uncharacterized protein GSPATT00009945001 [Paramecium tetraurelia]CAK73673.1 unnamed protein product [Paramecium tetraurelia]|eukprot:XP_001441070.1 hypothetical protein (macronuclear) [Paramecium tetraurelia strain d4-2]
MLKISNKSRKNEQLETIQVIEKCTKIMKEDRLQLRQMVKDENVKLIELVAKYKKRSDLNDLQQELRKFLKDKKGSPEKVQGAPLILRKVKSKERCEWNTSMSSNPSIKSPSRSNLDFRKKQKEDQSHKKMESFKKQEKLDSQIEHKENEEFKILDEIQEVKPQEQQIVFNTANSVIDPFFEDLTPVKMEFQTIVSQAPLNQSDQRSECILQYNAAEIQQYIQQDKHYVYKETYIIPQLISLNYKQMVNAEYQNLFTDWKSILTPQEPSYHIKQENVYESQLQIESEQSKQNQTTLKTEPSQLVKSLEIRGVTAEELFTYLVHHRFTKRLNLYQLMENAKIAIPNAQLDLDSLFKLADTDEDGWINLEDLGKTLRETCVEKESHVNPIKELYNLLNGNVNMDNFINQLNDRIQAEILYHEIDLFGKGFITYWEMYNHYEEIEKLLIK